jgi:hypothetical protein
LSQIIGRVHVVALGRLGVRKGSYDLIAAVGVLDERVRSRLCVTLAGHGEIDAVRGGRRSRSARDDSRGRMAGPGGT